MVRGEGWVTDHERIDDNSIAFFPEESTCIERDMQTRQIYFRCSYE